MQPNRQPAPYVPTQKSAFDEDLVTIPEPIVVYGFPYNINTDLFITRVNGAGTVSQSGVSSVVSTAAGANSFAQLLTKRTCKYNPGQGVIVRCAGYFTTGAAGSTQYVGFGSINDGFFFGYNGTAFGIVRRYGGVSEVRALTVTTKSSTLESITITLNGVTKSVPVTNGADTTVTANEIAAADYSVTGGGWTTEAVGNTVIFRSYRSGPLSGTYSLSGASTAVGTFAQTVAGVTASESAVAQTAWNVDKANGTGELPTLDPTKGNVYQIRFQWLGYGMISFYIANPTTGKFVLVHQIQYSNANTVTSINNPTLPFCIEAVNVANTTAMTITFSSIALYHEGPNNTRGPHRAVSSTVTGITTERPVLTIRNKSVFQGKLNRIVCHIDEIDASVDGTKNAVVKVYRNATLVGASFSDVSTNISVVQYDTSATSFSGGLAQHIKGLAKVDSITITHGGYELSFLEPGDQLTITVQSTSSTDCVASITWEEVF